MVSKFCIGGNLRINLLPQGSQGGRQRRWENSNYESDFSGCHAGASSCEGVSEQYILLINRPAPLGGGGQAGRCEMRPSLRETYGKPDADMRRASSFNSPILTLYRRHDKVNRVARLDDGGSGAGAVELSLSQSTDTGGPRAARMRRGFA